MAAEGPATEDETADRDPVPEPGEAALQDVQSPKGVKPGTVSEIEEAAVEREA